MSGRPARTSLGAQLALVTSLVAVVAVLVAGVVSYPLVSASAQSQAARQLGLQADLLAEVLQRQDDGVMGQMMSGARLRQVLAAQGIDVQVVRARGTASPPITDADLATVRAGGSVSDVRATASGGTVLVEGRPVSANRSVFLLQDAGTAISQSSVALRRLLLAGAIGLLVAVAVGLLAARRLVRPLREASDAAERMASGARDVALPVDGPEEVATVSESLNRLSAALASSEGRQRDFLLTVSHELRTPLTGITGYAEALADGVVESEQVPAAGALMLAEAQRLERLVADLLDLARLGAADLRLSVAEVDLVALCGEAAGVWAQRCEKVGVRFSAELPASLVARTDPLRVRQIIDNLCENALRVTPSGGPLVIALRPEAGGAVLEVRDGGPGLTADDVAVAFEPAALYERYRGVRTVGTGVGLALVGRLAERLGGRAFAGAAPEGGARIGVVLPASAPTLGP
ncbi:MAG: ATP-binding protein [Candidatus Nanopelagicales bacterium]